jgi:monofunctional biosynthetic peptidoglycan transglycosylase
MRDELRTLITFGDAVDAFRPIDDRVMGGVSRSAVEPSEGGHAVFTGNLSLEQNGGFASVRSRGIALDLSEATTLVLRARGDGKRYTLRLRDDRGSDDVSFRSAFETRPGEWVEVELPLDGFRATWRGRAVPDAPPLDRAHVVAVGLMISDGQAGEFELELDWLAAR